ncbi:hypothetical protein F0919_17080 [Taibaiella lutea]|uniref:Uncharacterized protein n=1 Tax=Taibaiella lutea TaxID=2608001 RepID=A0A5M6CBJ3_9BACT|nr:hypothetical protein [Taibaiella lutea]KAA5532497.1 hypothetical protein F0919_17080 [Taibaiella lutea]
MILNPIKRLLCVLVLGPLLLLLSCNQQTPAQTESIASDNNNNTQHSFGQYCNSRFGFCIDYPKDILEMQSESQSGDGNDFMDNKNVVVLTVFGRRNETPDGDEISLSDQFKNDIQELDTTGSDITYQKLGKKLYVISGLKNNKIFYRKTILLKEAFAFAIMEYQQSDSLIYNPLVASVSNSFK